MVSGYYNICLCFLRSPKKLSMKKACTIKLYVKQRFMAQKRIDHVNMWLEIEKWKTRYALKHHDYEIYLYFESKINSKN